MFDVTKIGHCLRYNTVSKDNQGGGHELFHSKSFSVSDTKSGENNAIIHTMRYDNAGQSQTSGEDSVKNISWRKKH
jgi:hypothetical protein